MPDFNTLPFPNRKRQRLPGFDYSRAGGYFVTICIQDRRCLLGSVTDRRVQLSEPGQVVQATWMQLETRFPSLRLGPFVTMPNHLHGVLFLWGNDQPEESRVGLPRAIQWFKTMTTNAYFRGVRAHGWPAVRRRLWQRGYHDRVLRDPQELDQVHKYIANNPLRWHLDSENPEVGPS